ncbi:MAG: LacI family transcriptional regulator, partial [Chloroflexi bacterium]
NVPLVAFGRTQSKDDWSIAYVDIDGSAGVRLAVEHLLAQGHRRIAALGWPEESRVGSDRLSGYWAAMETAGISIDPAWVKRGAGEYEYGYVAALDLLDLPARRRPTAIVTVFDLIAVGAMQAVQDRGLTVGHDVAITGFDDMPVILYLRPGLTTVRQPVWEVGERVVNILVCLLEGRDPGPQHILLPPGLVIRESSQGYQAH